MDSRSAITLRMEAGDRARGRRWDRVREPTGSPRGQKSFHEMAENLARSVGKALRHHEGGSGFPSSRY